jgi:hypothetical protein
MTCGYQPIRTGQNDPNPPGSDFGPDHDSKKMIFRTVFEQSRVYTYPNGVVTLIGVASINVSKSGTHRINLTNGKKVIMPSGWLSIEFDADRWTF